MQDTEPNVEVLFEIDIFFFGWVFGGCFYHPRHKIKKHKRKKGGKKRKKKCGQNHVHNS